MPENEEEVRSTENIPVIDDAMLAKNAVMRGYITDKHLEEARFIQLQLKKEGTTMSLGEILLHKHYLTITQLKRLKTDFEAVEDDVYPEIKGYEIIRKIRKGGMGTVYKSRQISMDRVVALKILAPELTDDETYIKRFLIEAKAVGKLNHENIVAGFDAGAWNGVYYFAMEFINGETIQEMLRRDKTLPLPFALNVVYQTTKALDHAAKHRIIHRDIKPGNIMINHNGVIKLCDLGFAKTSSIDLLTKKGTTLGTPYYMSPEQCRGLPDIDIRSDIYSLGATFYHMLMGKVPFTGRTASEILKKHLAEELVIPQEQRAKIGEGICHIIEKMMAKNREDRYDSPMDLLHELEPVMARFHAPKILMIHPTRNTLGNDLALLIATGAYEEGVMIDIIPGEDVKAEQLRTAGAIIIGTVGDSQILPQDIQAVLDIMERFSQDMRGKLGSAFVAYAPNSSPENCYYQLQTIFYRMINLGMVVQGSFEGILGGLENMDDPESPQAERCKDIGRNISTMLLYITAGKQTFHSSSDNNQPLDFS
ncbi:MAG: protein kinase [Planctomycetes bacterium]|jgi:serine/threonine-protein kinase|nr:protein kinase [Planctomycetota bacterium]HPY74436.1 serine/threonine-protein kinase [Planctomycetota bacterium]HQA99987.1 serine/threonine-protein kinase [Planctomycetota bacterium]HRU50916.1 serine/threonine-protein kinase [Planctomycetota bacterium]